MTRENYEDFTGRYFHPGKSDLNIFRPIVEAIEVTKRIIPGFSQERLDFLLYTGGASMMAGVRTALSTTSLRGPASRSTSPSRLTL